jgi:type II restriction enzyme
MQSQLDPSAADGYKSNSQIARRVTEFWFSEWMYCPSCLSKKIEQTRGSTKVVDFECSRCGAEYQLKSKQGVLGRNLRDAAYAPMMERVSAGLAPHFAFMTYRKQPWEIVDLLLVPRHFLTPAAIVAAAPLSATARRAGWVGCSIKLDEIPLDGRVFVIQAGSVLDSRKVRELWSKFAWLENFAVESRGWTTNVWNCIQRLGKQSFTLADVYAFEAQLAAKHPKNRHVRDKIRQQLQVLRDQSLLRFDSRGNYSVSKSSLASSKPSSLSNPK